MGAIDFRDVKIDSWVHVDGVPQNEIKIDNETVWRSPTRYYYYGDGYDTDTQTELTYQSFDGTTYYDTTTSDSEANVTGYINGGDRYPSGSQNIRLRQDEDYFMQMEITANGSGGGITSLYIGDIKLKFKQKYRGLYIGYLIPWLRSTSLSELTMTLTFGDKSRTIDFLDSDDMVDTEILFTPTTPTDELVFSFEAYVSTYGVARKIEDMTVAIEEMIGFE